jgi:signal transduction histidine kinase
MVGWDLCKRIKENPHTAAVKVLELSATLATAEDRARGLELGADCYLVHPVELVELIAALRSLIRLRRAEDDRARANELFLATLGHDLRNPLNTISAGLQLIEMSASEEDRSAIARMNRALDRMRRMIDQLLVFTQSLHEVIPASRQSVDLSELVRTGVRDARHGTPRTLEVHAERPVAVMGDADKLMQLFDNLLANAIRHGDGTVTVRVGSEGDRAVLAVHNGGAPIPASSLGTLFNPFTRAGGRPGGVGLGLYIVDQIARSHGGTVAVASTQEAGTTFTVRLPPGPAGTAGAPGAGKAPAPAPAGPTGPS